MKSAPIILVPGFWLGAWAWDEVAVLLRADGHEVTSLTLPGLESLDTDRSTISLIDHVDAICDAVRAAGRPVVLVVHSARGYSGYAASDRVPEQIAAMVYVDTGPGITPMDPDFAAAERPMPSAVELSEQENLDGLSQEQLDTFRRRAVPEPGGVIRDRVDLANEARRQIPSTIISTAWPSAAVQAYLQDHNPSFMAGVGELTNLTWLDLPTSHWPMWSKPRALAAIIGEIAARAG
jgi:pimeloyl-ACP methyl ester carboxylesterase